MDIPNIIYLLETGQIDVALKEADLIPFTGDEKITYNRKKDAYINGLKGQDLTDWIKEMKVFSQSIQLKTVNYGCDTLNIWHDLDKTDFRNKLKEICHDVKSKVKVILIEGNIDACSDDTHEILESFIKYDHKDISKNLSNIKGGMSRLLYLDKLNQLKDDWTDFIKAVFDVTGSFEQIPVNFRIQGSHKQCHIVVQSVEKFDEACFNNFQVYYDFWVKLNSEQPIFLCIHLPKGSLPRNKESFCNFIFCYSNKYEKVKGIHFRRFFTDHKQFYQYDQELCQCKPMTYLKAKKQLKLL